MKTHINIKMPVWLLIVICGSGSLFLYSLSQNINSDGSSEIVLAETTQTVNPESGPPGLVLDEAVEPETQDEIVVVDEPAEIIVEEGLAEQNRQIAEKEIAEQQEAQSYLEQIIDGFIYTEEPVLTVILKSKEFAGLSEQQRNAVMNRIIEKLNSGELRSEDTFSGRS